MGWKSTIKITKEAALKQAQSALASPDLTDEELANALEVLVGNRVGANYTIVSVPIADEKHLCSDCLYRQPACKATRIVWGIDRHPEARGADADKVLECDAHVSRVQQAKEST